MRENLNLKHIIDLKHTISEITSISLENDFNVNDNQVEGVFKIEGTYKTHGLSLNQEDILINVPFKYDIPEKINKNTINVNVIDFVYSIDSTALEIDIDYVIEGEEIIVDDFDDIEEFDRFLKDHEVELVNLNEDYEKEDINCEEEQVLDTLEEEKELVIEEDRSIENTIIENVSKNEETYITYHIYICNETDTLESIANKYNTSIETIREYNDSLDISCGVKLIIPFENE